MTAQDDLQGRLVRFGEPDFPPAGSYVERCDLTLADVPQLLKLIPLWPDDEWFTQHRGTPQSWAPMHAWRALAELEAVEVVEALLAIVDECDRGEDSAFLEEFPAVWARFGGRAVEPLGRFLLETGHLEYARICVAHGLRDVARADAEQRGPAVDALAAALREADVEMADYNGFVVGYLADLGAVEHADLIERSFDAGLVSEMICGDWPIIAFKLGVGPEPPRRQLASAWSEPVPLPRLEGGPSGGTRAHSDRPADASPGRAVQTKKDKAKRKRARAARKKNRRK